MLGFVRRGVGVGVEVGAWVMVSSVPPWGICAGVVFYNDVILIGVSVEMVSVREH